MSSSTANDVPGEDLTTGNKVLTTGAAAAQNFEPIKNVCAHLNAFHVYADEPSRKVETNHYCAHLNDEVRQCLLYDSPDRNARLIGIEYMITPNLYATLPPAERKLWHTHAYEVKSGMLVMPNPSAVPDTLWETAENREMEQVVKLYGKVYHLWQTDKGDALPMGEPRLMTSFTADGQMEDWDDAVGGRDARLGTDWRRKKEIRAGIQVPELHPDADQTWKQHGKGQ